MDKYKGKRLDGRYEILELIGVGGMAYVYKAHDIINDRIVAVKILKDEFLMNEEFRRRFKNESKAIAILSHPNIIKVYDVSFGDTLQYIVMEYVDGITLKEYMEQQPPGKWKESVHFTTQILRALQHAHDKGIVHRDIKPQNIMLLPDGTIKMTDFGIARFSRGDVKMTAPSEKAIGSVHYISPEQARGETTDEKSDIYSVGVMLYEMLAGRLPFEADNAVSVAIMQLQSEPTPLREINPSIPEGLAQITMKAMQKDPAQRYSTAAEMLYDIDEFKRNPSIQFEYKYMDDETPTRYIDTIMRVRDGDGEGTAEDEETRRRIPFVPILAAIAGAFVLAALVFVAIVILPWVPKSTASVTVPNLVGMEYASLSTSSPEAAANFTITMIPEPSDTQPAGYVTRTDPAAGQTRRKADPLTIFVSTGPATLRVPDVSNMDQDTATTRITGMGLTVSVVPVADSTIAAGLVVKTDPPAGTAVNAGTNVRLFVSAGPSVTQVGITDVTNMTEASARTLLEAQGLIVSVTYQNSGTISQKGIVMSQDPVAGTQVTAGDTVNLTVSSGFKNVTISVPLTGAKGPQNIRVFVNGLEVPALAKNGVVTTRVSLTLTEQQDSYTVTVEVTDANSGVQWTTDGVYAVNGLAGTYATLDDPDPGDIYGTTAAPTTATTHATTTTTETTDTTEATP
ncbi:MAG: Stk1 family PASTA domain-containing Ser/Thr kinase [Oscillospiraceae bacterium]|nr:Stk1 family PASTA domain-containing Ser/Thr kinase [Oscillospiraceae bacterium]